ncbi:MAG: hypothetical protein A4E31_00246 [Methanomassiliicoccales archaeon PtaU1.Bin030]|nr:MAG: hypothetical protein A4E31_00246 [Methanomassiliicoccales archaeon PtaU1.Bin030]
MATNMFQSVRYFSMKANLFDRFDQKNILI